MKTFRSLAACGVAISIILAGCTTPSRPASSTLSQKQGTSQTPTYGNTYTPSQTGAGIYGQNVATPRVVPMPGQPNVQPSPTWAQNASSQNAANGKVKVAILLPLSGKNAGLGQAMLNAAQQAVFDAAGTNFELQPHDTAGEGGAEGAARAAVAGGVQLIIGPLFATDMPAVMLVASNANLQVLSLSTDTSLAQRDVYVMGLAPAPQVERVVAYANSHGLHHYAALVPSTPYGSLVGQAFQNAVSQDGGDVVDYETYDPNTNQAADRAKQMAAQKDHIDAIFLPEAGNDLKTAADQLSAVGFDPMHTKVLGTGLWDVPGIGHLSPLLVGGLYAAPDPTARRAFISSYDAAYSKEPPRIATLAYDATALAAILAKRGAHYDEAALTNPNGFAGLDGIFRLSPSGTVERAMAVNEVTPDGAHVVDPAPTSFVGRTH